MLRIVLAGAGLAFGLAAQGALAETFPTFDMTADQFRARLDSVIRDDIPDKSSPNLSTDKELQGDQNRNVLRLL